MKLELKVSTVGDHKNPCPVTLEGTITLQCSLGGYEVPVGFKVHAEILIRKEDIHLFPTGHTFHVCI